MTGTDLAVRKQAARRIALDRRQTQDPSLGTRLAAIVLAQAPPAAGAVVAGFWPIGAEIDVRPLLALLAERGHAICLPVTPGRGLKLSFRHWRPGDSLLPGRFGTSHPQGEDMVPDYLLVPLLAFDRQGNRLGYGAGYYDRTLSGLPGAFRLGCAYASQEMDAVPAGPDDVRLHAVATERQVVRIG